MPRFVILEHDHPQLHWDLMLESGSILRTWRLAEPPMLGKAVVAEPSFDHRLLYLDYEGPVHGNRGSVKRWWKGTYEVVRESPDLLEVVCTSPDQSMSLSIKRLENGSWVVEATR